MNIIFVHSTTMQWLLWCVTPRQCQVVAQHGCIVQVWGLRVYALYIRTYMCGVVDFYLIESVWSSVQGWVVMEVFIKY